MECKKINFNEEKEYDNGEKFGFRFEGQSSNQNIDEEKINKLIDNFINEKNFHRDMLRNVSFLRTILKDFEEKLLVVEYNDTNNQEIVKYDNGVLFLFKCKSKKRESENSLNAEFTPGRGLSIFFTDFDEDSIIDYSNSKNINEQFGELIKYIGLLKGAKAVNLDMDSKTLIEIYKLFYNENPDFSHSNINVRIQTMMSILAQFGISLGEITDIDDPVKLADKTKKIIKTVGECVREVINDGYNKDEALITISKVIHAGRYSLSSNANVKELIEFTNCTQNEVESSIRLVKRIENKLDKPDK